MAKPRRYTEGRLYMAGATMALLLVVWAALTVRDFAGGSADPGSRTGPQEGTSISGLQPTPSAPVQRFQIVPHTRTRGS